MKKWKIVPVKKPETPSKSARENRKLPVKIFVSETQNDAHEKKIRKYARETINVPV